MASYYDMYGCKLLSLESAKSYVEHALTVKFAIRESDYFGKYYRHDFGDGEIVEIKTNFDSSEDAWIEENFKEYPVLLYVNKTMRHETFEKLLDATGREFKLLRREQI